MSRVEIMLLRILMVATMIGVVYAGLFAWKESMLSSQIRVLSSLQIVDTDWWAQTRCFQDPDKICRGIDIQLVKENSNASSNVVTGYDVENAYVRSVEKGTLEIYLIGPLIDKVSIPDIIDLRITVNYILHGADLDQDHYIQWFFQPWMSDNRIWFCKHALPFPASFDAVELDRDLARKSFGTMSSSAHYCLTE